MPSLAKSPQFKTQMSSKIGELTKMCKCQDKRGAERQGMHTPSEDEFTLKQHNFIPSQQNTSAPI